MSQVPGLVVLDRQNHAQDLQLSIRGFGARSTFGIRGVRVLVDGIPATTPTVRARCRTVVLPAIERVEVLRGALAQLYGNAAGGVLQVFTREGASPASLGAELYGGSWGTVRGAVSGSARSGAFVRPRRCHHLRDRRLARATAPRAAAASRTRGRPGRRPPAPASGSCRQTRSSCRSRSTPGGSRARSSRPTRARPHPPRSRAGCAQVGHAAAGRAHRRAPRRCGHPPVRPRVRRPPASSTTRCSVPLSAQLSPTSSGGIVELDRRYAGLGLQWSQRLRVAGAAASSSVAGADLDTMAEERRGYLDDGGVRGALTRDETDRAEQPRPVRAARLARRSVLDRDARRALEPACASDATDRFVVPGNPDDSGRADDDAINPAAASPGMPATRSTSTPTSAAASRRRPSPSSPTAPTPPA
jgi:iron complex outermembrane receptor protein